jgi:hypothetical protein
MQTTDDAQRLSRDQYQRWLMRHGKHWNDIRSSTEVECVAADEATAYDDETGK